MRTGQTGQVSAREAVSRDLLFRVPDVASDKLSFSVAELSQHFTLDNLDSYTSKMLRLAPRQVLRQSALPVRAQRMGVRQMTTGPIKRRSFKNTLARWGIAIGGIYWYNTSPIFNEAPSCKTAHPSFSTLLIDG